MALHWKIILGMFLGAFVGYVAAQISGGSDFVLTWVQPWGNLFINALKLIAVPLIFASLVKGISDLKDLSSLSKMGSITLAIYIGTTLFAITVGLTLANLIQPGLYVSETTRNHLTNTNQQHISQKIITAQEHREAGPLQFIENIVPDNLFQALSSNENMLQVIFFALLFGIALILIPEKESKTVKAFFDGFNAVILKIIDLIMQIAPLGVFALLAGLLAEAPAPDLLIGLGMYGFTVLVGLGILLLFYGILVKVFAKKSFKLFYQGIFPAQLFGFSTSSSAATLPVTLKCADENLNLNPKVSRFVLPIGATINMDGTSLYQAVAALFIAQAFGISLGFNAQLGILLTATLASIGSAAVPSAGMVMLLIVLGQAGIPEAGLALVFAIDRPLDMCRTTVNITGDVAVTTLVERYITPKKRKNV
jgi:proton glutamate symport protein